MTFCGKCGYNNPEDVTFCVNCGADLRETVGKPASEVERISAYNPNANYAAPMMDPYRPLAQAPQQPVQPVEASDDETVKEYNPSGRRFAIILSIVALALTVVSLFAIPLDFEDFNMTLLRIGMMPGQTTVLILTFLTLVIALFAILEPLMTIASGACLVAAASMVFVQEGQLFFTTPGLLVFILIAVDIIVLGIVSTVFMKKFVGNNLEGIPLFRACYLTWTGIAHR